MGRWNGEQVLVGGRVRHVARPILFHVQVVSGELNGCVCVDLGPHLGNPALTAWQSGHSLY